MLKALDNVNTEYVFLLLEDFFLDAPFNTEYFQKAIEYMDDHTEVGVINCGHTNKNHEKTDDLFFDRGFAPLYIVVNTTLYRTDILKKLIRKHENIWHYEQYSGLRAKKYGIKVMQYNEKYPIIYSFNQTKEGASIIKGKWLPNTKKLFDAHGIVVNYDNLGWLKEDEKTPNLTKKNENFIKAICTKIKNKVYYWKSIR